MGQNFFLFGGVSLASKSDILGKLKKNTGTYAIAPAVSPATSGKSRSNRIGPPLKKAKQQTGETVAKAYTPTPLILEDKPVVKINCKANGVNYGELSAQKNDAGVKLSFGKGYGTIVNDILDTFAQIQDARTEGFKDERIFRQIPGIESAVRVANWKTYCVKSSSIKENWIYISLNEKEKNANYIASTAGTQPDSDILYGKLITEQQFNKLSHSTPTTKIF